MILKRSTNRCQLFCIQLFKYSRPKTRAASRHRRSRTMPEWWMNFSLSSLRQLLRNRTLSILDWSNLTERKSLSYSTMSTSSKRACLIWGSGKKLWSTSSMESQTKYLKSKCKSGTSREVSSSTTTPSLFRNATPWRESHSLFSHAMMMSSLANLIPCSRKWLKFSSRDKKTTIEAI